LTIRRAAEADVPALRRLMQHVQDVHTEAHPEIFLAALDPEPAAKFFSGLLTNDRNLVLVAEADGNVVGYVWCEERESPDTFYGKAAHTGYIHHISVAPEQRRGGIGKQLIAEALADLKQRGATRIGVDFWSFNARARAFFTGLGFAVQREIASKDLR
jgi:ribosomal protein S18 acetylase RimI-like enzyme